MLCSHVCINYAHLNVGINKGCFLPRDVCGQRIKINYKCLQGYKEIEQVKKQRKTCKLWLGQMSAVNEHMRNSSFNLFRSVLTVQVHKLHCSE